ncbi:MAG: metallophosphoesterase family protein [Syntrophales bacterium]
MNQELPRILSPNLGCPIIISPEDLKSKGLDVVMAEEGDHPRGQLSIHAKPSFEDEGEEFVLELSDRQPLKDGTLPPAFGSVDETRYLISTTLASSIFAGKARFFRYRAQLITLKTQDMTRLFKDKPISTLYDLCLTNDGQCVGMVFHALCLRPAGRGLNFIHLTDLHIALRNDLYNENLRDEASTFNNFNENLRRFIRYANKLADEGELDFVLVLGDLVDFLRHGFNEREDYGHNNLEVFRNLILGHGNEKLRPDPNMGLKMPIFTTTGNHDWRFFPYDAALFPYVFGVDTGVAEQFDLYWADEQEEISQKIETVYAKLLREGSPISNRTSLGCVINWLLQWLQKWQVQVVTTLSASALIQIIPKIPFVGSYLHNFLGSYDPLLTSAIALFVVPPAMVILTGVIKHCVRNQIVNLLAIDAGWQALKDYFLTINPYFNYSFRMGNNYFLIMDTGHDCLRAQYLWDDGDKKLGPLSIDDNAIGHSPDVMAFYDANEYYPYNQINWIDRLMQLIHEETRKGDPPVRIFIGLHAPPANLSRDEHKDAYQGSRDNPEGLLLTEGKYNTRYGTINHFVSQFLHLCLGRVEGSPDVERLPVDMVLAGHAHWKLELRLEWDYEWWNPLVYYGDFTGDANFAASFDNLRPFLLQTPAAGPREEEYSPDPPYFRELKIDEKGRLESAKVMAVGDDGSAFEYKFPW